MRTQDGHLRSCASPERQATAGADLAALLGRVAAGEEAAFEAVYDRIAPPVFGIIRAVLRDPDQSEEVTQDVLTEIWRTASRFDPGRGSAMAWVTTIAHRRAVDRVRAEQKARSRQQRAAGLPVTGYDQVTETVQASLDRERVRRCLGSLTDLQCQSVTLAYYGGYTYRQVATLLRVPPGTISTRIRDGLIRLRDCLGGQR